MSENITSLDVIKKIIELSREFKSENVDSNLYESIKESTNKMRETNPSLDIEYFYKTLYHSTILGANKLLSDNTFEDTVEMIIEMGKEYARLIESKEDFSNITEGLESDFVRFYLKLELVTEMLRNSVSLSMKAIQDSFSSDLAN
jgi:hypothetical protein